MRKTARPVVWEGAGAQSPAPDPIKKNITARLQYGFYRYDEPSSGHFTDYTAQVVFATLTMALP